MKIVILAREENTAKRPQLKQQWLQITVLKEHFVQVGPNIPLTALQDTLEPKQTLFPLEMDAKFAHLEAIALEVLLLLLLVQLDLLVLKELNLPHLIQHPQDTS
jgi:hypothetical protein